MIGTGGMPGNVSRTGSGHVCGFAAHVLKPVDSLSSVRLVRLLQREHPLGVVLACAQEAAAGQGSLVLVAGEAGIGKTALLRTFAAASPVPVLWGMCDSLSTPRPLGPLRDVADDLGADVGLVPPVDRGSEDAQEALRSVRLLRRHGHPRCHSSAATSGSAVVTVTRSQPGDSRSPATRPSRTPAPTPTAYAPTLSGSETCAATWLIAV